MAQPPDAPSRSSRAVADRSAARTVSSMASGSAPSGHSTRVRSPAASSRLAAVSTSARSDGCW
jgi:hypothetical protein